MYWQFIELLLIIGNGSSTGHFKWVSTDIILISGIVNEIINASELGIETQCKRPLTLWALIKQYIERNTIIRPISCRNTAQINSKDHLPWNQVSIHAFTEFRLNDNL